MVKIATLEGHLKSYAERLNEKGFDLEHHRGTIALLLTQAASMIRELHDDYDALIRQDSEG